MAERRSNYVIRLRVDGSVKLARDFDKVGETGERSFRRINKAAGRTNTAISGVARQISTTLIPAFVAAASAGSIFRNIQSFEKLDIRLRSLTQSAEDYANTQDYLRDKANELNVDIETLANGYARLLVLQNSGILNRAQVNQLSEGLVNAAAQLGASGADIDRVLFGLSQGLSAGTLRAEELNQVVEPLPGLLQELDRAAGTTAGGFRRMVNAGKVSSELFANTLVTALQSYEGAAAKLDVTISGSLTRLNNAWVELARTIGESGVVSFLADLTEGMTTTIDVATRATEGQMAFAEATSTLEQAAFLAARGVKIAYLTIQTSVLGLARGMLRSLETVYDGTVNLINLLPGVEIAAQKSLTGLADRVDTMLANVGQDLVSAFELGPSEASIKALREQEKRVQDLQRAAEEARSAAKQEKSRQEAAAKAGPPKVQKALLKQLAQERAKIEQVTQALKFRNAQMLRDAETQELYTQLQRAGVALSSAEGQQIQTLVAEYHRLKQAKEQELEISERQKQLLADIHKITEEAVSAQTRYNTRMQELQTLLDQGKISLEAFQQAGDKAYEDLLRASDQWFHGAERALRDYADEATDMAANVERVIGNMAQNLEETLVQATTTGSLAFKDLVDSMIEDIARLVIRSQITGPLASGIGGLIGSVSGGGGFLGRLFADGAAFTHGKPIKAFARGGVVGGIVDRPTLFPMAKGAALQTGLMGEAGPEAIMPLARTASGKLGVEAVGGTGGNFFSITVDARGSQDPASTAQSVQSAVDQALTTRIPGIVKSASQLAHQKTVDTWQRRGSRFE